MKIDPGAIAQRMKQDLESAGNQAKTAKDLAEKTNGKLNDVREDLQKSSDEIRTKLGPAIQDGNKAAEKAKKFGDGVEEKTKIAYTFVRSKLDAALDRGVEFVMAEGSTGDEIGVDNHIRPRDFDYGKYKKTIAEFEVGYKEEKETVDYDTRSRQIIKGHEEKWAGIHGRVFGHLDKRNLNASIGMEGEAGTRYKSESGSKNSRSAINIFAGVQGRVFWEGGAFGTSLGAEAFAGYRYRMEAEESRAPGHKARIVQQVELGIKAVAHAHLGPLGFDSGGEIRAGLRNRMEYAEYFPIPGTDGTWQIFGRGNADIFIGGIVTGAASLGISPTFVGAQIGVEAFAGFRARLQATVGLAYEGTEILSGFGYGEGWIGVGARAKARAGYDAKTGELGVSGEVGVAVGAGGAIGFGVSTPIGEFGDSVDKQFGVDETSKKSDGKQIGPNFELYKKRLKNAF